MSHKTLLACTGAFAAAASARLHSRCLQPLLPHGTVIGECVPRHRADEFLAFLKKIDRETPAHLDLHLILDNYATHKTPAVKRWLARHQRFKLHFTPTSCSWLNMVERLFVEITRQRIRRGTFHNVAEIETAIAEWFQHRNQNPRPFTWTASAKSILV